MDQHPASEHEGSGAGTEEAAAWELVPHRRPWRWVAIVVVSLVVASLINSAAHNERFEWGVIGGYLFDERILRGLGNTLILTAVSMVLAFAIGLWLAMMRMSESRFLRVVAGVYIWGFRGTPILVQLLIWYNLAALYPVIALGVPFGPEIFRWDSNTLITAWVAALLGLALNEGAYLAEVIRGGIMSVDRGQVEAGRSLGMSNRMTFRRIVLPQTLRVIVPPVSNETIGLLKYSAIVSVITLPELLYAGQLIYARTYETIPVLLTISIWYLVVTSVLTVGQMYLERRLGAGWAKTIPDNPNRRRWTAWLNGSR